MIRMFGQKDPLEAVTLTFNFAADLLSGETLAGEPIMHLQVHRGADASPSAVLNGAAALDAGNTKVLQPVHGGLLATDYLFYAECATTGGRNLVCYGVLPVRRIY